MINFKTEFFRLSLLNILEIIMENSIQQIRETVIKDIIRINLLKKTSANNEIKKNLAIGKLFLQGEDLLLKLTSGVLKLDEVRLEGKKTMIASDFVKGHQVMKINSSNQ